MSELETPTPRAARARSGFNIYTIMMLGSFVALATAVGVMWYMNVQLTGESNPFFIVK